MCATVSQPWDEWDDSRVFVGAESGHVALRALLRDAGGPESSPNDDVGFCTFAGPSVFPRLHRRVQRAHSVHVLLSVVSETKNFKFITSYYININEHCILMGQIQMLTWKTHHSMHNT